MRRSVHLCHDQVNALLQENDTDSKPKDGMASVNPQVRGPVPRVASKILHLLWLCVLALTLGFLGFEMLQPDAVGGALARAGTCLQANADLVNVTEKQALFAASPYDPMLYLQGAPRESFRDNLNKYITSWTYGGWTNDFMAFTNLLYLSIISGRIPILPPFPPSLSHLGSGGRYASYSEIFDLPRLREALRMPIVEWKDVKQEGTPLVDALGCWSPWATMSSDKNFMRNNVVNHLNIDVSYTSTPALPLLPNTSDPHVSFWGLSALTFPEGREKAISSSAAIMFPSPLRNVILPPDAQLACFDVMYYVGAHSTFEWQKAFSPAWRFVGTHTHWNPTLQALAELCLRSTFGIEDGDDIPPFVALHARRGDFSNQCKDTPVKDCLASLQDYAAEVERVQDQLLIQKGISATRVFVASDERDSAWWEEVKASGWYFVDYVHEGTVSKHGKWYPVLIDAVIQSMASGFVGTARSTLSLVSKRRVEDWNNGVVGEVQWGRKKSST